MESPIAKVYENWAEDSIEFFDGNNFKENCNVSDDISLEKSYIEKNQEDFVGDLNESTEISSLLASLDSTFSYNKNAENLFSSEATAESTEEILSILKRQPQTTRNIKSFARNPFMATATPCKPKQISMAGKILKVSTDVSSSESMSPVRNSNPAVRKNILTFEKYNNNMN